MTSIAQVRPVVFSTLLSADEEARPLRVTYSHKAFADLCDEQAILNAAARYFLERHDSRTADRLFSLMDEVSAQLDAMQGDHVRRIARSLKMKTA